MTTGTPYMGGNMVLDNNTMPVVFSDDGAHWAYFYKAGNECVVMQDGKELCRGKWTTSNLSGLALQFSAGGKHLFFSENDTSAGFRFIVDGKPEAWLQNFATLALSPDGSRYAYAAPKRGEQKSTLFVDGKEAGYPGEDPQFTADSQRLIVLIHQGPVTGLLIDGKLAMKTNGISHVYLAPVGSGYATVLQRLQPRGEFLVVNNKKVEGSDCQNVSNVFFSPDGKRFAALCKTDSNAQYMIIDGKKGDEYPNIDTGMAGIPGGQNGDGYAWERGKANGDPTLQAQLSKPAVPGFTPDSSKFVYVANAPPRYFLVVNGEESDAYTGLISPVFGGGGKRIGFILNSSTGGNPKVVIDGKATEQKSPQALSFSPDGSHYKFLSGFGNAVNLYVDGAEVPGIATEYHQMFSPDGKHLVIMGFSTTDNGKRGLFIDGKLVVNSDAMAGQMLRPAFTPDSQHLIWIGGRHSETTQDTETAVLFVDGKPSVHFAPFNAGLTNNWEMSSDGVLTFVARSGDNVKRYRVTPGSDTSIATMLANAK
jgi:hypothetical protein